MKFRDPILLHKNSKVYQDKQEHKRLHDYEIKFLKQVQPRSVLNLGDQKLEALESHLKDKNIVVQSKSSNFRLNESQQHIDLKIKKLKKLIGVIHFSSSIDTFTILGDALRSIQGLGAHQQLWKLFKNALPPVGHIFFSTHHA
ncbi:hypothetical protein [Psychroflexus tropicus]|uniref:hypothetical protein n=1 Tax=Psychroflexus tropicus TaxID=197345 RepID=UPI00036536CC|nr:hypothetical protein [Psychroflexus tropicus]